MEIYVSASVSSQGFLFVEGINIVQEKKRQHGDAVCACGIKWTFPGFSCLQLPMGLKLVCSSYIQWKENCRARAALSKYHLPLK